MLDQTLLVVTEDKCHRLDKMAFTWHDPCHRNVWKFQGPTSNGTIPPTTFLHHSSSSDSISTRLVFFPSPTSKPPLKSNTNRGLQPLSSNFDWTSLSLLKSSRIGGSQADSATHCTTRGYGGARKCGIYRRSPELMILARFYFLGTT
jgi:hypothetical protein